MKKQTGTKASAILRELAERMDSEELTFGDVMAALGDRSFAAGILFFSLPNTLCFATIPGVSSVTAVPIALFALQLLFRHKKPWLPAFIAKRSLPKKALRKLFRLTEKWMAKIEHGVLKPRLPAFTGPLAQGIAGVLIALLAFILFLPIPLGNFVPGLAVTVMALGLIESDGLVLLIGILGGLAVTAFFFGGLYFGIDIGLGALGGL